MDVLPEFKILDYLDSLQVVKETHTEYHCKCPVCNDGGFKIKKADGKFSPFKCDCSIQQIREAIKPLKEAFAEVAPSKPIRPAQTRRWEYRSWDGQPLAAVKRIDDGKGNKQIAQGHWDGNRYIPGLPSNLRKQLALYRWNDVQQAIADGEPFVYWVEGEACADALWAIGLPATTSIGGSSGYTSYGQYEGALKGVQVVVCPDMDLNGVEYARKVAKDNPGAMWLYAFPSSPQWEYLDQGQGKGADVEDWIADGVTKEEIVAAIEQQERQVRKKSDQLTSADLKAAVLQYAKAPSNFDRALLAKPICSKFGITQRWLDSLAQEVIAQEARPLSDMDELVCDLMSEIEARAAGDIPPGLASGFYDLDSMTQGFQRSDLIIAAGRPGMGKTAWMLGTAGNIAAAGHTVLIFSLEMSKQQLTHRMLSTYSQIDLARIRTGQLSPQEWEPMGRAIAAMSNLKITIDDTSAQSISGMYEKVKEMENRERRPDIIMIDFLQLMPNLFRDSRESISYNVRELKNMARNLDLPVISLSQLNRGVEARNNKRPLMSDLREAGQIEEAADLVLMLYRDEYYDPESVDRGIAEINVAKHRNGPTGTIKLLFQGRFTQFHNLKRSQWD